MAEDIAQDATISVHRDLYRYQPEKALFSTWMRMHIESVTNHQLAELYRVHPVELSPDDDRTSPSDYSRLSQAFADEQPLLQLLLAGNSLVACEQQLGLTRKALRHKLAKIKKRIVSN